MSVCPTAGDVNFDHLGKAGLPGLSSVVTVSSLSDNNILWSDVFNILLLTQTYLWALASMGDSCLNQSSYSVFPMVM